MKVKSEREVAQSCLTPSDPMDCSLPGSSVHGIFQARVLEWGAIAFSGKELKDLLFVALGKGFLKIVSLFNNTQALEASSLILFTISSTSHGSFL